MQVADVGFGALAAECARFGLHCVLVPETQPIPGSYWGDREAGLVGDALYVRLDTPMHSALHEASHFVCMDPARRRELQRDAGGDHAEENAVCYLQIVWATSFAALGRTRMLDDMDRWGYSFRLGSAVAWFSTDAEDARAWLAARGLIDTAGGVTYRLRS